MKPHMKSCYMCKRCWYHENLPGEHLSDGPEGWVCDGHQNPGVANLKSFPFRTEQKCFEPRQ